MKYIFVDVERDGPYHPKFSMVCFGAVIYHKGIKQTFYGETAPISDKYYPEKLAISGFTREQHEAFQKPEITMQEFANWLSEFGGKNPCFISDCLTGDWDTMNYYLWEFTGDNPFGYSGRRLSDIIGGYRGDLRTKWKHLKSKVGAHDPIVDALENAKIFAQLEENGLKI